MTAAALLSGGLIGLILALVGGGGSIIAVPLLVYVVGLSSPHAAIGTAAVAVAANAATSLIGHARSGTVKWPCAIAFAAAGVAGAAAGAELGKAVDGHRLLTMFGLLMVAVGVTMLRGRHAVETPDVRLSRATAGRLLPRLVPMGFAIGTAAGFFGIGGGFLIVPGLMFATAMPLANAVATSLVVVTALGLTTASSYAVSGFVDWQIVGWMVMGGAAGAWAGIAIGRRTAGHKALLERLFALIVIAVGVYVAANGLWVAT